MEHMLAQNIRRLRLHREMTQEELAERLSVTAQAVSRWERGECYPDITLLPGLANLFGVSTDELLGMEELYDSAKLHEIYTREHALSEQGKYAQAAELLEQALKLYPNEYGMMSDLAQALALVGGERNLRRAIALCECVLANHRSEKCRATTRAALVFIYRMAGEPEKADELARTLPHVFESREEIRKAMESGATDEECLRRIYGSP